MKLTEFYEKVKNPIDKEDYFNRNIDIYAESVDNDFYYYASKSKKTDDEDFINYDDTKYFKKKMFDIWITNILKMDKETVSNMCKENILDDNFLNLYNFLNKNKEKDIDDIIKSLHETKSLKVAKAFRKYYWNSSSENNDFTTISSSRISDFSNIEFSPEHALYINLPKDRINDLVLTLIDKFEEKNCSYKFKYSNDSTRDGNFIIYANNDNLSDCIEILEDIKSNTPIFDRVGDIPLYAGSYEDFIGYGSIPTFKNLSIRAGSYEESRASLMKKSINNTLFRYFFQRGDTLVKYNNRDVTLKDYMTLMLYNEYIKSDFNKYGQNSELINADNTVIRDIYNNISNNIESIMSNPANYFANEYNSVFLDSDIKPISIDLNTFENFIKVSSKFLKDNENIENFVENVKDEYEELSFKYGISMENNAFDNKTIASMKLYDVEKERKNSEPEIISSELVGEPTIRNAFDVNDPSSLVNKYDNYFIKDGSSYFITNVDREKEEVIAKDTAKWLSQYYNYAIKNSDDKYISIKDYINKIVFLYLPKEDLIEDFENQNYSDLSDKAYMIDESLYKRVPEILNRYSEGLQDNKTFKIKTSNKTITINDDIMMKVFKHVAYENGIDGENRGYIESTMNNNKKRLASLFEDDTKTEEVKSK